MTAADAWHFGRLASPDARRERMRELGKLPKTSGFPWDEARALYVEGEQREELGMDGKIEKVHYWPTLEQVAERFSVPPHRVRAHSGRHSWKEQREWFKAQIAERVAAEKASKLASARVDVELDCLAAARTGIRVVRGLLQECDERMEAQRAAKIAYRKLLAEGASREELDSCGFHPGEKPAVSGNELVRLSRLLRGFQRAALSPIGTRGSTLQGPSGFGNETREQGRSTTQESAADDHRQAALVEATEAALRRELKEPWRG